VRRGLRLDGAARQLRARFTSNSASAAIVPVQARHSFRRVAALAFLMVLVALAVLFFRREPTYRGKTLTRWAEQFGSNNWREGGSGPAGEARTAIRAIGSNGIPFLVRLVGTEESWTKRKLRTLLPLAWHDKLRLKDESGTARRIGAHGLAALGTNAPGAVPELIKIASTHPDEDGRDIAVLALRTLRHAAEPAIPFLIQCLTNESRIIRDDAAIALGFMHRQPQVCAPALTAYLRQVIQRGGGGWELTDAIAAVGECGTNSEPAVSILVGLLDHEDADVRRSATNALRVIKPLR
jgi:hypothetical protein